MAEAMSAEHGKKINRALAKAYPDAHCSLDYRNALELLIATILSAQCTDVRVNQVTPALFKKYQSAKAFAAADQAELEQMIRSTGFYRNKAKSVKSCCAMIAEDFNNRVPDTMEELITLPGVARKTANVVLGNVFGKQEGIVVDTHVRRLSQRMGLSNKKDPNKIEQDLMEAIPRKDWTVFGHRMIDHGRAVCKAKKPLCAGCCVEKLCPSAHVF